MQKSQCIITHELQSAFMWPCSWSRAVTCDPTVQGPQDCFRMQLCAYDGDDFLSFFFLLPPARPPEGDFL